jgi:simple sugar transport system permease protein
MVQTSTEPEAGSTGGTHMLRRAGRAVAGPASRVLAARRETPIFVVTVLAFCYFAATAPNFLQTASLQTLLTFVAPMLLLAAGLTPLLVAGEIDVSVGQTFALVPVVIVRFTADGTPLLLALLFGLIAAALVGVVNGVITTYFRLSSFVVTLGMFFVLSGLAVSLLNAPVTTPGTGAYASILGGARYSEILWGLAAVVVLEFVLVKSRFGLHLIAAGANVTGAQEIGIRVRRVKIIAFTVAAVLAGFTGVLESVRVTTSDPAAGGSILMFEAVAAVVIGGTLLTGGAGTVIGSLLGALFLGIVNEGFSLDGVSAYLFDLIVGIAILIALIVNSGVVRLIGGRR